MTNPEYKTATMKTYKSLLNLIAGFLLSTLVTATAFAVPNTNPQMRECRLSGGTFFTMDLPNDQIGLCQLDSSILGALDLMYARTLGTELRSVAEYKSGPTICTGMQIQVTNLEGTLVLACLYLDGSIIDIGSLITGKDYYKNGKINSALGLN